MKRFVRKRWGFLTIILLLTAATTTILPLPAAETSPTTNNISPDATVSTNDTTMSPEEMVQLGEDFYFGRWRDDQAGTPDNITEAARWFRRAAEMGNARGQCRLGMYYCHSTGWSSSLDAEKWFISAAAAGDPEAQAWLGNMYVERKQFEEAFVWLRRSADQESPFGMLLLGLCYQKGDGVETDPVRGKELCDTAIESIRECAELGDVEAMDRLGICYANGQGTEMDLVLGRKWFRKAAEAGYAKAQCDLTLTYLQEAGAQFGTPYSFSSFIGQFAPKDLAKNIKWLQLAAEQGHTPAQYTLGALYFMGMGVEKSDSEGIRWTRLAAEAGNVGAQLNFGALYRGGFGVEKNDTEAFRWTRLAAEAGNAVSQYRLGYCYGTGTGVAKDEKEAVRWFTKAATQGNTEAMTALADCCRYGRGVPCNPTMADEWFRSAVRIGNTRATDLGWFTEQALTSSRSGEFESMSDWNAIWNGNTPRRTTIATSNHRGTGNATIGTTNTVTIGGVPEWNWNENGDENENTSGVLR